MKIHVEQMVLEASGLIGVQNVFPHSLSGSCDILNHYYLINVIFIESIEEFLICCVHSQLHVTQTHSSVTATCASTTLWCVTVCRTAYTPGTRTNAKVRCPAAK